MYNMFGVLFVASVTSFGQKRDSGVYFGLGEIVIPGEIIAIAQRGVVSAQTKRSMPTNALTDPSARSLNGASSQLGLSDPCPRMP